MAITDWKVSGVKTWNGTDGIGMQCNLLRHGRVVAQVTDDGCGGCFRYAGRHGRGPFKAEADKALRADARAWAATQPEHADDLDYPELHDLFVDSLVEARARYDEHRRIAARFVLCFRLVGDEADAWRTFAWRRGRKPAATDRDARSSAQARCLATAREKYGDTLDAFLDIDGNVVQAATVTTAEADAKAEIDARRGALDRLEKRAAAIKNGRPDDGFVRRTRTDGASC